MSRSRIVNPRFQSLPWNVSSILQDFIPADEMQVLEDVYNQPMSLSGYIQILTDGSYDELFRIMVLMDVPAKVLKYFNRRNPIEFLNPMDPEYMKKIELLIFESPFVLPIEIVFNLLDDIKNINASKVLHFYDKYHDLNILHKALTHTDKSNRKHFRRVLSIMLSRALLKGDEPLVEYLLSHYQSDIKYIIPYQNALQKKRKDIADRIIEMGYQPPPKTSGKRTCDIVKLRCSDMDQKDQIQLWKEIERQQKHYFIHIRPLRYRECENPTDFFLIATDKNDPDVLCSSMLVEQHEDNSYYVALFSTRTLMDPAYGGIGKSMIQFIIDDAKSNAIDYIYLNSVPDSVDFYKSRGFKKLFDDSDTLYYVLNPEAPFSMR